MKAFFFCFMLVSSVSYAKNVDFTQFNSRMNENLNEVIEDNPQMYETKSLGRTPASVTPVKETSTDKLDNVDEQANTHNDW
mgnify:CR=1 FL=1